MEQRLRGWLTNDQPKLKTRPIGKNQYLTLLVLHYACRQDPSITVLCPLGGSTQQLTKTDAETHIRWGSRSLVEGLGKGLRNLKKFHKGCHKKTNRVN